MDPDRTTPYWRDIVGDNWPEISPAQWHRLAARARDGARVLDLDAIDRASRSFDHAVLHSRSLEPIGDRIRSQRGAPHGFAQALNATADALEAVATLVDRTRHQILDIVENATRRIVDAQQEDRDEDRGAATHTVLRNARADVEDVIAAALAALATTGLFELTPPHHDNLRNSADSHSDIQNGNHRSGPLADNPIQHTPATPGRTAETPRVESNTPPPMVTPQTTVPGYGDPADQTRGLEPLLRRSFEIPKPPEESAPEPRTPPANPVIDGDHSTRALSNPQGSEGLAQPGPPADEFPSPLSRNAALQTLPLLAAAFGVPLSSLAGTAPSGRIIAGAPPTSGAAPPTQGDRSSEPSKPTSTPRPSTVAATSSNRSSTGTAPAHERPARHTPEPNSIRESITAAIAAAAAPTHIVGETPDTDLILAKALLASLRAVTPAIPGFAWATAVLRHPGGVTLFLTSNEGRGWMPDGIHLPTEISTPWSWSEAQDSWSAIDDPARTLAEFCWLWKRRNGARLSALASSQAIDSTLEQQLVGTSLAHSVRSEPVLDLERTRPQLRDRLELIAEPSRLAQISSMTVDQIRGRRITLARYSGNGSASRTHPAVPAELSDLRAGILAAHEAGTGPSDQQWQELSAIYDLLAANLAGCRTRAPQDPLGVQSHQATSSAAVPADIKALLLERRRSELVLLLRHDPSYQNMRDMVYAYSHLRYRPATR